MRHTLPFNGPLSRTTLIGHYQKTFIHSHPSCPSDILYQLPSSSMIHSILFVQFTCLTVVFFSRSSLLWSSSWSGALYFILHAFLHSVIIIFSPHMPIPSQPVLLFMSSIPNLSLSSLLGNLSLSLMPHIHLTILISAHWSATTFSFLTGQVSIPCNILLRTQLLYNLPLIISVMRQV